MSVKNLIKFAARLSLITIAVMALANNFPARALADSPTDLEIDVIASTPWDIVQAVPGDSGTKTIELHNAGTLDGFVYIWISNIVNGEGANPESEAGDPAEPGELGKYLFFRFISSNITTNVSQPAIIENFPYTVPPSNPYFMKMPLDAGATITGVWQWSFTDNGIPQNDAQGDSLSFNINYYLTEPLPKDFTPIQKPSPSGEGRSGFFPLFIDILGVTTNATLDTSDKLNHTTIAAGPNGKNILEIQGGTKITGDNGRHAYRLELKVDPEPPSPPQGMQIIGDAYDLIGYTGDLSMSTITFDPPAKLTLDYETAWLPKGAAGQPCLASCDDNGTWQIIQNSNVSDNPLSVSGLIDHTTTYAILVETKPITQTTVTTTRVTTPTSTTSTVTTPPVSTPTETTTEEGTALPPTPTISSPDGTVPTTVSTTIKQAGPGLDDLKNVWRQVSLGVALAGVTAMSVLALLERQRRLRRPAISAVQPKINKRG